MDTDRNTHFKGLARVLLMKLLQSKRAQDGVIPFALGFLDPEAYDLTAQFLYDFAGYVLDETTEHDLWIFKQSDEGLEDIVPDLTEWPKPDD